MSFLSDKAVNTALDALIAAEGTLHVGLSTTKPSRSSSSPSGATGITEPLGGGYARVTLPVSGWAAASDRLKVTNVNIAFPNPTADWGQVGWVVVWNDADEVVVTGDLDQIVNVKAGGDQVVIPASTMSVYLPA